MYSIRTPCCVPGGSRRARVSNNWVEKDTSQKWFYFTIGFCCCLVLVQVTIDSRIFSVSAPKGIDWKELRGTSFGEASERVVLWGSPTWNKTLQGHFSSEVTLDILIDKNLGFKSEKKTSFSRSTFFSWDIWPCHPTETALDLSLWWASSSKGLVGWGFRVQNRASVSSASQTQLLLVYYRVAAPPVLHGTCWHTKKSTHWFSFVFWS